MSTSRDDFGIVIRSALLQRGAAQKFSLISLIILALILFFLDVYSFKIIKPIRSIINDGVYRVSILSSTPSRFFPSLSQDIVNLVNIKSENQRLKEELEIFKKKELEVEYLANENENLKKIFKSDINTVNGKTIIAKVLIDKSSPYLKSVVINKGSKQGILKGMPVLDKFFLIGRIVETNYFSSRVLLLNDLNSRIPVTISDQSIQAILKGNSKNKPILEYLPEGYVLKGGLKVFTSGKDGIFLPGTPIGETQENGEVKLYSEPGQLTFIKINMINKTKENF